MHSATEYFRSRLGREIPPGFPIDPLDLVCVEDGRPRLIVHYDWEENNRLSINAPRAKGPCTHVFATIFPGQGELPVTTSFSARCLTEIFQEGAFRRLYPELQVEAEEVFGALEGLSGVQKVFHPNVFRCIQGYVSTDPTYIADSYMSAELRTDKSIQDALDKAQALKEDTPFYEVRSLTGWNCQDFVYELIKAAGLTPPFGWEVRPWPGVHARVIETLGRFGPSDRLQKRGAWSFQTRTLTQLMHQAGQETTAHHAPSLPMVMGERSEPAYAELSIS